MTEGSPTSNLPYVHCQNPNSAKQDAQKEQAALSGVACLIMNQPYLRTSAMRETRYGEESQENAPERKERI